VAGDGPGHNLPSYLARQIVERPAKPVNREPPDDASMLRFRQVPLQSNETTMKIDPATIAAMLTAFSEIPVRVAAMERTLTELA
jgi:hypothetical protein